MPSCATSNSASATSSLPAVRSGTPIDRSAITPTDSMMLDDTAQRSWHFKQLRWSLHRLAAAGSAQPVLFPDFEESPDDLAFHFDHWGALVRSEYAEALSEPQLAALDAIERKLATMSRDDVELDADLWTEAALRSSVDWADVRQLAAAALDAFGWADDALSGDASLAGVPTT